MTKELNEENVGEIIKEYADKGLHIGVDLAAPGSDRTVVSEWVTGEYHRAREKELLEANNRYLERARKAEARVKELEGVAMSSISRAIDHRFKQFLNTLDRPPARR